MQTATGIQSQLQEQHGEPVMDFRKQVLENALRKTILFKAGEFPIVSR
jgi:hypothetical protein